MYKSQGSCSWHTRTLTTMSGGFVVSHSNWWTGSWWSQLIYEMMDDIGKLSCFSTGKPFSLTNFHQCWLIILCTQSFKKIWWKDRCMPVEIDYDLERWALTDYNLKNWEILQICSEGKNKCLWFQYDYAAPNRMSIFILNTYIWWSV